MPSSLSSPALASSLLIGAQLGVTRGRECSIEAGLVVAGVVLDAGQGGDGELVLGDEVLAGAARRSPCRWLPRQRR